jgi:hypothetical protein
MDLNRRQFLTIAGGVTLGALTASKFLGAAVGVQAQAIPGAQSFQGAAGKSVPGPAALNAGMAVLRAQHNGTGNFTVTLFLPNPAETPAQSAEDATYTDSSLSYDEIGMYKGGAVAMIGTPGAHYLAVNSSGAFSIGIEQPLPSNVSPAQQTTFSGKGKDVSPYFTLPSSVSSLSVQTSSSSFRGWLYHVDSLGGGPVQGGINVYDGRFFDFTFPGNQTSYPVSLPDSGPYLLATDNLKPTDTWTFTFQ